MSRAASLHERRYGVVRVRANGDGAFQLLLSGRCAQLGVLRRGPKTAWSDARCSRDPQVIDTSPFYGEGMKCATLRRT